MGVMSELLGVRLLLPWGCFFLWMCCFTSGALVISRSDEEPQGWRRVARSLQKRSADDTQVELHSVMVDCTVTSRFAHTVMTSTALNKCNSSREIFFEVELPKSAFITNFSMEIEGKVYVGQVKEKEKAKKQYDKAVSSGQTAGLVKASGRKMEKFSVSVNIAAESNVTFILTYEELLRRNQGSYEILTRVKPKSLVQQFQIIMNIYEPQGLSFVDSHSTFLSNELLPLVEKTVSGKKAHISFSPTIEQQRKCSGCDGTLIDGDFIVKYDVNRDNQLGDIQIVNGYFVHFFAPPYLQRVPMNVVFVIDKSGSMTGKKMSQTRESLSANLKDLNKEDYFAIVTFNHDVGFWNDTLTKATEENVVEALRFVSGITAGGYTDINSAVLQGVSMLKQDRQMNRLPERSTDMIILLTDGMPYGGETNIQKIQQNVKSATAGNISLFSLGFGNDVDYSFLDVLSRQNKGVARRIFEATDAALQLEGFFDEVSTSLLLEVDLQYPDNAVDHVTTNHFAQLFNGSEIIVAGQLTDNNIENFIVSVCGQGLEEFKVEGEANAMDWGVLYPDEEYIFGDYMERLWAYLTIQQLLEQSSLDSTGGGATDRANASKKALDMSLQYSFVTPLTSMVVTKPDTEDGSDNSLVADKLTEAERQQAEKGDTGYSTSALSFSIPQAPPGAAYFVDGDPHVIIELPNKNDSLCFNIYDAPGTIFNLIRDLKSGISVNGQIIGDKKIPPSGKINTYFNRFGIIHLTLGVRLEVSTEDISVFQDDEHIKLLWTDTVSLKGSNLDLQVIKDRSVTATLKGSVKFVILLHKVWKKHPYHRDYLGFYTLDTHLMSPVVHGLLGQFYNGIQFEVKNLHPGETPEKPDATMYVKGQELTVTRGWQRDFRRDLKKGENVPCWFIHNNGTGLIDGDIKDYVVSGLFETKSNKF